MHSFFSRHEVDKRATGFRQGEEGYPSAGKIAWLLWGGDSGQTWARRKVTTLDKERDGKNEILDIMLQEDTATHSELDQKAPISQAVKKGLAEKVKEHNDKHGDKKGKAEEKKEEKEAPKTTAEWRKLHSIAIRGHGTNASKKEFPDPFLQFADAPFGDSIQRSLKAAGFAAPTAIQSQVCFGCNRICILAISSQLALLKYFVCHI